MQDVAAEECSRVKWKRADRGNVNRLCEYFFTGCNPRKPAYRIQHEERVANRRETGNVATCYTN